MKSDSQTVFILAAADQDIDHARRFRTALLDRGLNVSLADLVDDPPKSARLIVLCSPAALLDDDLNRYVEHFTWQYGFGHVYTLGIETERPVMPMPLRAERRAKGGFRHLPEPRALGALYTDAMSLDRLADSIVLSVERQNRPMFGLAMAGALIHRPATAGLTAVCAVMMGVTVWQADMASEQRQRADEATGFTSRLLTDITQHLPDSAREATLMRLADDLTQTYLAVPFDDLSDEEAGRRAQLFHLIGEARDVHGDATGAQQAFASAYDLTATLLSRAPTSAQRMFDHSQSAYWVGNRAYRSGDLHTARTYFEVYAHMADTMVQRSPHNLTYRAEQGYAAVNLGAIALDAGQPVQAAERFAQAINLFDDGLVEEGVVPVSSMANSLNWRADAQRAIGDLQGALLSRQSALELYRSEQVQRPSDQVLLSRIAHTLGHIGRLASQLGRDEQAQRVLDEALEIAASQYDARPENDSLARDYVSLIEQRSAVALGQGDLVRAQLLLGDARRAVSRNNENGELDGLHGLRAQIHTISAQIALTAGVYDTAIAEASQAVMAYEAALDNGFESHRFNLANAQFILGEAQLATGLQGEARSTFRFAVNALESMDHISSARVLDLQSRLAWRLANFSDAQHLRATLEEQGYASRDYQSFWETADRDALVSTRSSQGG